MLDNSDCDDTNSNINPSSQEICDNIDNDCDELIDGSDDDIDANTDIDSDGDGFSTCGGDCDDTEPTINPDALEFPFDSIDQTIRYICLSNRYFFYSHHNQ